MNSFRSVERAIDFEIERQAAALDAGEPLAPGDPRLGRGARRDVSDAGQGDLATTTATSRSPTCRRSTSTPPGSPEVRAALPELPAARRARYRDDSACRAYDAAVLVADPRCGRALRGAPRAADPAAARQGGRELGQRRVPAAHGTPPPDRDRGRSGAARGGHRRGRRPVDLPGQRPRGPRGPRGLRRDGRSASSKRAASGRSPTPSALGAVVDEVLAANPGGRRRLPGGQGPGRRLPRRPGHEGDPRPGQCGPRRRRRPGPARGAADPATEG